jgi:hypothetical protein
MRHSQVPRGAIFAAAFGIEILFTATTKFLKALAGMDAPQMRGSLIHIAIQLRSAVP